jgi:hypothetical protein
MGHRVLVVMLLERWVLEVMPWVVLEGAIGVQSISGGGWGRCDRRLLALLPDEERQTPGVVVVVVRQFVTYAWGLLGVVHRIGGPMWGSRRLER